MRDRQFKVTLATTQYDTEGSGIQHSILRAVIVGRGSVRLLPSGLAHTDGVTIGRHPHHFHKVLFPRSQDHDDLLLHQKPDARAIRHNGL